ncbi:MAG: hypothetical protein LBP30_04915, partial [Clostridiales Family XIII bacterium]|nr:hypothetical protein [Clostridiales Family XIII bacterium]
MADFMLDLFRAMPKAELHMHLDGALEVRTAMELMEGREPAPNASGGAAADGRPVLGCAPPSGDGGFPQRSYEALYRRLVIGEPLATQAELLSYYDLPIELLQSEEALARVADDLLRAKAADRVRYCEIR